MSGPQYDPTPDDLAEFGQSPSDYRRAHKLPWWGRARRHDTLATLLGDLRVIANEIRDELESGELPGADWRWVARIEAAITRAER